MAVEEIEPVSGSEAVEPTFSTGAENKYIAKTACYHQHVVHAFPHLALPFFETMAVDLGPLKGVRGHAKTLYMLNLNTSIWCILFRRL